MTVSESNIKFKERRLPLDNLLAGRAHHSQAGTPLFRALRQSRYAALFSLLSLMLLLFPILSTADDFHVCQLSLIRQASPIQAEHYILRSSHSSQSKDEDICLACSWMTVEGTMPTALVTLPVLHARTEDLAPQQLPFPLIQTDSSKPERAPPLS